VTRLHAAHTPRPPAPGSHAPMSENTAMPSPEDYADAVATYLASSVSGLANRSSTICGWDSSRDNIRSVFARQALPMTWDYAEANPIGASTGAFSGFVESVDKSLEGLVGVAPGEVTQTDATVWADGRSECIVSTDPPYYDNIGYADLSDFFYVWLRRSLKSVYPQLLSTMLTPKSEEMIASPYRHGGSKSKAA